MCALFTLLGLSGAPAFAQVSNTATVAPPAGVVDSVGGCTSAAPPVCSGNNTATDSDSVVFISVAKTLAAGTTTPLIGGQLVTYNIVLSNPGGTPRTYPANAITETVPQSTTAAAGDSFNCAAGAAAGTTCTNTAAVIVPAGTPAAPGTVTLTFRVRVLDPIPAGTTNITNAVAVPGTTCANSPNDCSESTPVAFPQVALSKSSNGPWSVLQTGAQYTLSTSNGGGAPTSGTVTVVDVLPAGITPNFTSPLVTNGWTCSASGQAVTCTSTAQIAAGGTGTQIVLPVNVTAAASNPSVNYAAIGGGGDPDPAPAPGAGCAPSTQCASDSTAVRPSIDAVNDPAFNTTSGGGTTTTSVVANDTMNGVQATLGAGGNATITGSTLNVTPANGGISLNPATGQVTVANATTPGTYVLTYTLCTNPATTPATCDTATQTIVVTATIDAVNDSYGPLPSGTAATTASVIANDRTNSQAVTLGAGGNATLTPGASPDPGLSMNPATGVIAVAATTPPGVYQYPYTICTNPETTPATCDTASASVTIYATVTAVDDAGTVANGAAGGTAVPNVLVNDRTNGQQATLANVTLAQVSTTNPNVTLNPATGAVNVAAGTPVGTYVVTYQICTNPATTPPTCDTATVTVTVNAASIVANDELRGPVNGASGGTVTSVLGNDTLNGAQATVGAGGNVTLAPGTAPTPAAGSITMNADGTITVAPGTTAGTYAYPYRICEVLNPTNCDTATATVTVVAAAIVANDDTRGPVNGASGATLATVLNNDTLNGVQPTAGPGGNVSLTPGTAPTPAAGSITMNADGTITVAPGTTAGTYTYPYRICEVLNPTNCATAIATVRVVGAPVEAFDDSGSVVGATGGVAVPNVLANDSYNGNVPATLANVVLTQVSSSNTSITLDVTDGSVDVASGTPAGEYTLVYQICERLNPTNCDTATVVVTVDPAPIDAFNDSGVVANGTNGGQAIPNVLANDTLNNVVPITLAAVSLTQVSSSNPNVTLDVSDGSVDVAPGTPAGTYTLVYEICERINPTNCDRATATVTVNAAPIVANNDTRGPVNGASGATLATVLNNDTLNGVQATVGAGGNVTLAPDTAPTPAAGSITMNADGTITVAPGTTAGTYAYQYRICEVLNPTNCATAVATVTVSAALIVANDDTRGPVNGANGGTVASVLVSDTLNGAQATAGTGGNVTLLPGTAPVSGMTMNTDTGTITVAPGTAAGRYDYPYEICEVLNPSNCDSAIATVIVLAPAIIANDDTRAPVNGSNGATLASVLNNDTLNGAQATVGAGGNVALTPGTAPAPAAGSITMNADGTITVAPGTTAGTYAYPYTICEVLNPTNCDPAIATVTVLAAPIVATDDTIGPVAGIAGNPNAGNAYANDTLNGQPVNPSDITGTVVTPAAPINGGPVPTLDPATGVVSVPPGTPAGTYTIEYRICQVLNPLNCDTATITVTVDAAPISAVNDRFGPVEGIAGNPNAGNAYANDTLNGQPVITADITGTVRTPATPINGGPVPLLDPATGTVSVPAGTPAGTYTITYQICENLNPTNCAIADIVVTVSAAPIVATDDAFGPVDGAGGNPNAGNAYANDTLNGQPVNPADITGTVLTPATPINGGAVPILNTATGVVSVPPGTPAGTYTITYQICEALNPTNCDTATITVTVEAAPIDALGDSATTPQNTAVTISVLGNDTLNGQPVSAADVTVTQVNPPANGSIVVNPDGTITYTPAPGFSGTDTFTYQICENLNPTNCSVATVTVTVPANQVTATDDVDTTPQNTPVTTNVLGNDTTTGAPLDPASVTVTVQPQSGTVVVNPDGTITYTPNPGFSGTVTYTYQVCDTSTPTPVCDTAVVTITVRPNEVTAVDDSITADPEVSTTIAVIVNDTTTGAPLDPESIRLVTPPANGVVVCQSGACTYTSNPGFTGTDTFTYRICDLSTPTPVCDEAVVTLNVVSAAVIRLVKQSNPRDVRVGDLVRYTIVAENVGEGPVIDGTLVDTPPAGFTFVDGSLTVADSDGAGRLVGVQPTIRVDQVDIAAGERATITYLLRVGAGVRAGVHTNTAQLSDNGSSVSNVATANVQLIGDPLLEESLIVGTVFDDRDGDGWQDSAAMGGVRVQGGFAPGAYVANSTTVDRGNGPQPEPDASSPMLHGIAVGEIGGRQSEADPAQARRVVISQLLRSTDFTSDFVLTTKQGVTVRMDAAGNTTVDRGQGDAAKGLTAAAPKVERRVAQAEGGYRVDYVITNEGVDERGVPGVRIASVEGLIMETDQYGRYHVVGIDGGRWEHGRNFILKVDAATLPPGTTFTTDNPLVRRITPGLPVRFDFGVKLPPGLVEAPKREAELELGEVVFVDDGAEVAKQYLPVVDKMAEQLEQNGAGEVVIAASGASQALAYDRAKAVQDALVAKLSPEQVQRLRISLRTNPRDQDSLVVALGASPLLGRVLFDTDKADIKPEYDAVLDKVAADLDARAAKAEGDLYVGVVGNADKRGSDAYNLQLGMRRAKAVYEALAAKLSPDVRKRLRVEVSDNPAAPTGGKAR